MGAKKGRKKEEEEEEPDYINIHYIDGSWFFNEPDLRLCVCLLHRDRDRSAFFLALAASRFLFSFFFRRFFARLLLLSCLSFYRRTRSLGPSINIVPLPSPLLVYYTLTAIHVEYVSIGEDGVEIYLYHHI